MARLGAMSLVVAALVAFCVPANATKIERVVSPGGIEFWFVRDGTVPLVSIEFAFRGGAVQDPDDKTGPRRDDGFDARRGRRRPRRARHSTDGMERNAIELQIRASREHVRGTLRTLKENQDEAFNLLRLALNEPRFDSSAVERIRAQTVSSLQRQSTNPNSISSRNWWATAFPNHPYGRPVSGTLESVARVTAGRHARLRAPRARARQAQDRRRRRHRTPRPRAGSSTGPSARCRPRRSSSRSPTQRCRDWAAAPWSI